MRRTVAKPGPRPSAIARVSPRVLMAEAEKARRGAYAPYSGFPVGAALLTLGGRIIHGSNVENASFGLSVCAERTALWKAVTEGEREFEAIAVTAGPGIPASPCGACRQVLREFAPDLKVYWHGPDGRLLSRSIEQLLSSPFSLHESRARVAKKHGRSASRDGGAPRGRRRGGGGSR